MKYTGDKLSRQKDSLNIGIAGEHIVCADLLLNGHNPVMCNQNSKYDILAETLDKSRLLRIQVKTTARCRQSPPSRNDTPSYTFRIARATANGAPKYKDNDFDILACVALDSMSIAYIPWLNVCNNASVKLPLSLDLCDNRNRKWMTIKDYPIQTAIDELEYVEHNQIS
jgi:hypothetical protein